MEFTFLMMGETSEKAYDYFWLRFRRAVVSSREREGGEGGRGRGSEKEGERNKPEIRDQQHLLKISFLS